MVSPNKPISSLIQQYQTTGNYGEKAPVEQQPANKFTAAQTNALNSGLGDVIQAYKSGDKGAAASLASTAGDIKRFNGLRADANFSAQLTTTLDTATKGQLGSESLQALHADIAKLDPATLTGTRASLAQGDQLAIKNAVAAHDDKGLDAAIKKAANNYATDVGSTASRDDFLSAVEGAIGGPATEQQKNDLKYVNERVSAQFPQGTPFP